MRELNTSQVLQVEKLLPINATISPVSSDESTSIISAWSNPAVTSAEAPTVPQPSTSTSKLVSTPINAISPPHTPVELSHAVTPKAYLSQMYWPQEEMRLIEKKEQPIKKSDDMLERKSAAIEECAEGMYVY